ncbi:hypothetical protein DFJ73DRAFT_782987 [Zopfochytrium polystomum]|nr:hypothetical protein DFJ73DRAFT_782987 [Zopfochytrium polystomum]
MTDRPCRWMILVLGGGGGGGDPHKRPEELTIHQVGEQEQCSVQALAGQSTSSLSQSPSQPKPRVNNKQTNPHAPLVYI